MTDRIIHKHSTAAGNPPIASDIDLGELAVQAADGHIYLKRTDGTVVRVTMLPGGGDQQILYKTGPGDYALGWGTITKTLMGATLWSEVIAEVQSVFALVEGTASVLLAASATLPANSTGPITVSVADATYLTDGTSITGVLGTAYGTLSRSGSTYSFTSNQSYTSDVSFATGTRFAAAFLNNNFNPLRVGDAELEDSDGYTEGSGYAYALTDSDGRIGLGIKQSGEVDAPSGRVNLAEVAVEDDNRYTESTGYAQVVSDKDGRIAFGIKNNGAVQFTKGIDGNIEVGAGSSTFKDVTITGDLTVQGDTVTIDVTNLAIEDNTILLNKGETGNGVTLGSAGIEIDRGTAFNVTFRWNEPATKWIAEESIKTEKSLFTGDASLASEDAYTEAAGYGYALIDLNGRIAFGVTNDGALEINKAVNTKFDADYEHAGYAYAFADSSYKIAWGVRDDGSIEIADYFNIKKSTAFEGTTDYSAAVLDEADRLAYGVKKNGSFEINNSINFRKDSEYDHLGYAYVIVDADGKIAFAVTESGEVYTSAVQAQYTESATHGGSGLYTVVKDALGRKQIQAGQDSGISVLTSVGNNWGPAVTAETPERIVFLSDRNKDAAYNTRYWVMNSDGSRQAPATPNINDITFWGDSMTQRLQSYAHLPGLLTGRTITYNALGGTSVEHIIARQGGENATCTIPSGSIPTSGSVALQNVWPSLGLHAGTISVGATYSYLVTIAGVQGTLTSTTNASSQADYTFTRTTGGSSVAVSGPVEIIVLANLTQGSFGFSKSNTAVFWMGTNPLSALPSTTYDPNSGSGIYYKSPATIYDPTNSVAVQARTEQIVQALLDRVENLDRHVLITGPFIGQGQVWASSVEKQAIVAGFATFSKHWYDLRSDFIATCKTWLQTNHPTVYASWATTDDDHVANGAAPPILREDSIHLNTYGSQLVSQLIASKLSSKQW